MLQQRAAALGVELHFGAEADLADADLIVGADGVNSTVRRRHEAAFRPTLDPRRSKYMWLGTELVFDAFKFFIAETEHGVFQVHGYPYGNTMSTFIVETSEETLAARGARSTGALAPGESDAAGHRVLRGAVRRRARRPPPDRQPLALDQLRDRPQRGWHHENVVLLGDAAHTAHFSIGSGTKLALEDAIGLAWALREHPDDLGARWRLRGRPPPDRREHPARRPGQPRVVRGDRALRRAAAGAVRVQPAHAQPAHHLRRAAAARLRVRRGGRRGLRLRRPPADVHAVPPARARAGQPRGGLADGHVLLARRHARRLPPRAPRRAGSAARAW